MYRLLYLSCFQLLMMNSAALPMQFVPIMPQRPQAIRSPLPLLQEQLMELQTLEQVHPMSPMQMNRMQPIIVLLPGLENKLNTKSILNNNMNKVNENNQMENEDSVVLEAEPMDPIPTLESNQKAVIILPNGRFSLNSIISSIPWLPLEINVPDTISWMYNGIVNGISGIISIIGQQSSQGSSQESKLKYMPFNAGLKVLRPIVVLPM